VSRSKIKEYSIDPASDIRHLITKNNQFITLQKVTTDQTTDYVLKVKSDGKAAKERSMKSQFEERFIIEINKVKISLTKKYATKKADKVNQRIGRAIEKYPSAAKFYEIEVVAENGLATGVNFQKKSSSEQDERELGSYFIKTNLDTKNEK